jgi:hypothetical protein
MSITKKPKSRKALDLSPVGARYTSEPSVNLRNLAGIRRALVIHGVPSGDEEFQSLVESLGFTIDQVDHVAFHMSS